MSALDSGNGASNDPGSDARTAQLPVASSAPIRARSLAWFWPLLAIGLAIFASNRAWDERGPELLLRTNHGHGISPGNLLLYRGIAVGEVRAVELSPDLGDVEIRVRLEPAAESMARAGSRFWIVRPDIALDRLRGVETILGARHVTVLPGPVGGAAQHEFICLDEEPILTRTGEGAVEFFLEAPRRFGLGPGAPITYRDVEIGMVLAVGLASDATSVEMRAIVRGPYAQLVRENTRFWETGGIEFSAELLGGVKLDLESLRSLLVGGVALATPTQPGRAIRTGHRFHLAAEAEEEWLAWGPALALGSDLLPQGTPMLELLRARLVWEEGIFGLDQTATGWLLPLAAGVVGPAGILVAPEDADGPALEVRGEKLPITEPAEVELHGLALRPMNWPDVTLWPMDRIRELDEPEDVVLQLDSSHELLAVAEGRLRRVAESWSVDPAIPIDEGWNGAAVLARLDGFLVGILVVDQDGATIRAVTGLIGE